MRHLRDIQGIAGRADEHVNGQVLHQEDLPGRVARRGRHNRSADLLDALVKAESAREQPVPERNLAHVLAAQSAGHQEPRAEIRPQVDVGGGVGHERGLARRSGRAWMRSTSSRGTARKPSG